MDPTMVVQRFFMFLAVAALCTGCATFKNPLNENREAFVTAKPLAVDDAALKAAAGQAQRREFLGRVTNDSYTKCGAFLKSLTLEQQTINYTGDIATTVFSALASVFKPISTVHGLTAAATISSGSKAALLNALYAKATIVHFQNAIGRTYYKDMGTYVDALAAKDDASIVISAEVSKIQSIHALCSLSQAEAAIAATLVPPAQGSAETPAPAAPPITLKKSFSPASIAVGGTSTLTITLGNNTSVLASLTAALTDTLPSGLVLAATPNVGGTCTSASVSAAAGGTTVSYASGAPLPVSGCTITVAVTAASANGSPFTNTLPVGALKTTQGDSPAVASAVLTVTAAAPVPPAVSAPTVLMQRDTASARNWGRSLQLQ